MDWVWAAVICGLIVPWIVMPKRIIAGFGRSIQSGVGMWAGIATLTLPFTLLMFWTVQVLFG
jgi:hypothetical protein